MQRETPRRTGRKMETRLFIAALLLLLAGVDGVRRGAPMSVVMVDSEGIPPSSEGAASFDDPMEDFEDEITSPADVPPDFFCHSCQKVSRKMEKLLTDPSLYDEVDTISTDLCRILRSDLKVKCRKIVELYLREGILFLQIVFGEKNLCNSTGFCIVDNRTSPWQTSGDNEVTPSTRPSFVSVRKVEEALLSMGKTKLSPFKRKRCDACRVATEQIRKGLEDHEQQIKVIKSLLDACEAARSYAERCKRMVFQYGPLALSNLQKFLSSQDFCQLIHMCEEAVLPPKRKSTGPMYLSI